MAFDRAVMQQFRHPGVDLTGSSVGLGVGSLEQLQRRQKQLILSRRRVHLQAAGQSPLHQHLHPVADPLPHRFDPGRRTPQRSQHLIHGPRQIRHAIHQSTVQIKE